jgi:DNA-binding XRE family transcriptional regulator
VTNRQILRLIGANVKAARLRADVTQECLAELVEVHWQTISNVEQGKFPFSVATFARISQVLETSPNRLLDGLEEPDKSRMEQIKKMMARRRQPKPGIKKLGG